MPERIAQAFDWLRRPAACPVPDQGPVAAKVYLIYRAIDGLLTDEEEAEALAANPATIKEPHRRYRWQISLYTALAYLDLSRQNWTGAVAKAGAARLEWSAYGLRWWPPQIINYLRMSCVEAYYQHLIGQNSSALVEVAMEEWRRYSAGVEWKKWPYIWVEEMIGQAMAVRLLVFIGRACGTVQFNDFGQDYCGQLAADSEQRHDHIFYSLLRSMGNINTKRAIWTP